MDFPNIPQRNRWNSVEPRRIPRNSVKFWGALRNSGGIWCCWAYLLNISRIYVHLLSLCLFWSTPFRSEKFRGISQWIHGNSGKFTAIHRNSENSEDLEEFGGNSNQFSGILRNSKGWSRNTEEFPMYTENLRWILVIEGILWDAILSRFEMLPTASTWNCCQRVVRTKFFRTIANSANSVPQCFLFLVVEQNKG